MEQSVKEIVENCQNGIAASILGVQIYIKPEIAIQAAIYKKYYIYAEKAAERFTEEFNKIETISDFFEVYTDLIQAASSDICCELSKEFLAFQILDYSPERIFKLASEECELFQPYTDACEELYTKMMEIAAEYDLQVEQRDLRKESRGRWSSATFGGNAMNAWSNQMHAEAMNLAEGLAHSAFNSIMNSMDRQKAERKMNALFENPKERDAIIESAHISFCLMPLIITSYLNEVHGVDSDPISSEARERCKSMLENLKRNASSLSKEQMQVFIKQMFEMDPASKELYVYFVSQFGDEDGSFEKLAEQMNVPVRELKNTQIVNLLQVFIDKAESDDEILEQIDEYAALLFKKYGLDKSQEGIANKTLEKIKVETDLRRRTVDGIEFVSYEEADKAKQEKKEMEQKISDLGEEESNIDLDYEQKIKSLLDEFETNYETKMKEPYKELLKQKLDEFDKNYRTVDGVTYDTRDQAKAQRVHISIVKIMQAGVTYENVCEAKQVFQELLRENDITEESAVKTVQYLNSLDEQCRTLRGIVFETYELYLEACREDEEMNAVVSSLPKASKDSTLSYEKMILKAQKDINEKYHTRAKEKYLSICDEYLRDFEKKFCTVSMFKKLTREEAAQERAVIFLKNQGKIQSMEELENVRQKLIGFLPELGLTLEQAVKANQWISKTENNIQKKKNKKGLFW